MPFLLCKEELLATDTLLELIEGKISQLETVPPTPIVTYVVFDDDAYKKMATVLCNVKGKDVTFSYSGATYSVIQALVNLTLSGNYSWSTGASGHAVKEMFSVLSLHGHIEKKQCLLSILFWFLPCA